MQIQIHQKKKYLKILFKYTSLIKVTKTRPERGPLAETWKEDFRAKELPVMCAYKIVRTRFEVWGLQTKMESWAQRVSGCWRDWPRSIRFVSIKVVGFRKSKDFISWLKIVWVKLKFRRTTERKTLWLNVIY